MYALAIDLGTTTLAVSLVDLRSGRRLAMAGCLNPQRRFGADVVSRLDAAVRSEDALREMSGLVRAELWRLSDGLLRGAGLSRSDAVQIAIAGNPAMQHILLGLPVRSLAFPPFRPLHTQGRHLNGSDLEWDPAAAVYLFPMPGGFVGGDTVAFLYGEKQGPEKQGPGTGDQESVTFSSSPCLSRSLVPGPRSLFLDLGTNGEMALTAGDDIWATAAAAGPAFEGGNLSCGMAALPGAINSVTIQGERVHCTVIGNVPPVGICGSAAIEAVSELLDKGVLESNGRLRNSIEIPSNLATRIVRRNDENAFVLHRDARHLLLLTQSDIRQIQLAKGAIRAGLDVLAERSRIQCQGLQEVVLTGSFGTVLRPEWLKSIGIFDSAMVHITRFAPEGALAGVERALLEKDDFSAVEHLAERFRVIPLSGTPQFESKFMENIDFPHP